MTELNAELLIAACSDTSAAAGLTITAPIEPMAGPGAPVKPPIYAPTRADDGPQYQFHSAWRGTGDDRRTVVATVIDNVPSQANRIEAALAMVAEEVGLPEYVLDLTGVGELPAHVPTSISSFLFPHRGADAYLRDAELDGTSFGKTDEGKAIFKATDRAPEPLLAAMPQALVLGQWQSHLGKAYSQAKLARSWTSEITGYEPALLSDDVTTPRRSGIKGDQLNLSTSEVVYKNVDDQSEWTLGKKEGGADSKDKLSEIGHGQVPFSGSKGTPEPLSFREIEQRATLGLAGLRRLWFEGEPEVRARARAVPAALALFGHVLAFGRPFTLRSGTDLRVVRDRAQWLWLGDDEDVEVEPLTREAARALFEEVVAAAGAAGLPVGDGHWRRTVLTPNKQLSAAIRSTYPKLD
jgi:CRISPR-associated protein Csb1